MREERDPDWIALSVLITILPLLLTGALGGFVMLVGAADAGAEQRVMTGVMADNAAGDGASQAPGGMGRARDGDARKRDDARNRHDNFFHDTLRS
jgi:hypothetical protein